VVARVEIEEELAAMGIQCAESQANFAWFDLPVPDGEDPAEVEAAVVRGLAERGVIVRAGGALGKPGALRVTYGAPGHNRRFLDALRELVRTAATR
jgi:histidinol-phosphate aminotransferase